MPGPNEAIAESGIIVSFAVETAAPDEALDLPLAAIELFARLRAESAARVAALVDVLVAVPTVGPLTVPAVALVLCAPLAARYFDRPIRWARPVVAVTAGVACGAFAWRFHARAELPAYLYLALVGSLLAVVDVAVKRLPNPFTLPSYLVGLVLLGAAALLDGHPARIRYAAVGLAVRYNQLHYDACRHGPRDDVLAREERKHPRCFLLTAKLRAIQASREGFSHHPAPS